MEDLYIKEIGEYKVFFRKSDAHIQEVNQSKELERIVYLLTGEEFEDYNGRKYKRKLKNPDKFQYIMKYDDTIFDKLTCLCGENTCNHLIISHYIPNDIYFAVGSVCINRFDEDNGKDLYHILESKKCKNCNKPLVFKDGGKFEKNTKKKCYGRCFECVTNYKLNDYIKRIIYLKCPYDCKDDAKSKGAKWDADKKKWWIYHTNPNYDYLMEKYRDPNNPIY